MNRDVFKTSVVLGVLLILMAVSYLGGYTTGETVGRVEALNSFLINVIVR